MTMDMNRFLEACDQPWQYPQNVIQSYRFEHCLKAHSERLSGHAERLFIREDAAAVDFLDFDGSSLGGHLTSSLVIAISLMNQQHSRRLQSEPSVI
jgi:hypothetical protein